MKLKIMHLGFSRFFLKCSVQEFIILQKLSYLPWGLSYRFIFSSETDSMALRVSEKTGAILWVMVG